MDQGNQVHSVNFSRRSLVAGAGLLTSLGLFGCSKPKSTIPKIMTKDEEWQSAYDEASKCWKTLQKDISKAKDYQVELADQHVKNPDSITALQEAIDNAQTLKNEFSDFEAPKDSEKLKSSIEELKKIAGSYKNASSAIDSAKRAVEVIKPSTTFEPAVTETLNAEDPTGVQLSATVKITPWMKGDDVDILNSVWESAGGSGDFPIDDSALGSKMKYALAAIGQISYTNGTPDFDAPSFGSILMPGFYDPDGVLLNFKKADVSGGFDGQNVAMAYETSNNGVKIMTTRHDLDFGDLPNPVMEDANWGPVPFCVVFSNFISPNYPDGNPELENARLDFMFARANGFKGDDSKLIQLPQSW